MSAEVPSALRQARAEEVCVVLRILGPLLATLRSPATFMVVGLIAPNPMKPLDDMRAVRHQPCCLLDWRAVDFRCHPKHAEVEVCRSSPWALVLYVLDLRVFPCSRPKRVFQHERTAS